MNLTNDICTPSDVTEIVKKECDGKRRCQIHVNTNTFAKACLHVSEYLHVKYQCLQREPSADPCSDKPCGFGALCNNVN